MYLYELTQLKSPDFPFQVILYLFVGGIASGVFLVTALIQAFGGKLAKVGLHRAYYIAFLLTPICGALLIMKLQRMERFINVLWQGRDGTLMLNANSPMSLGAWVLLVFSIFAVVGVLYAFKKDGIFQFAWAKKLYSLATVLHEGTLSKIYLALGSFFAAWLSMYLGVLLTTSQLPAWNATALIPTMWVTTAVATGVAVLLLTLSLSKKSVQYTEYIQGLNRVLISAIVLNLLAIIAFVIGLGDWGQTVNGGTFGLLLWGGTVFLGLVLPLLLKLKPNILGVKGNLIASSILVLVGGFILRYVVVMGPQSFW